MNIHTFNFSPVKKAFQFIGFLLGWSGVILQYYLAMTVADSRIAETVKYISFMTIWTNILVSLFFTFLITAQNSAPGRFFARTSVQAALVVYISAVGLIYHLFLAHIWNPQGLQLIVDQILHTVVPVYYLLYWMLFSEKNKLSFRNAFNWLLYPFIYAVYSLIRGAITGKYPYYFIDASTLGYGIVLRNIVFIALAYFALGMIVAVLNNLILKFRSSPEAKGAQA